MQKSAKIDVAVVGAACRLPGARDESAFRALLFEGRCAVGSFPTGRWNVARHLHPSATERGFSYSFAGGYLDDPFAFDTSVFGLSPREASQMDPQQRLLLEVVWEALEDARIPASSLAGTEVGVYVGASSLDHGNLHASDPASIDSYFMTGNTLSVIANRISYAFDWHGPSFTVDTACSSSLVAFSRALDDIRSGRIDIAVVAGVNILLSPFSFVGFSRASMLSPTGLCRPFSADADGYVRSEGAVALVLTRADVARPGTVRAFALAADVNSDGRTSGIALPGLEGQVALLERVWNGLDITPEALAFVEAHGTGTRIGDPIEATALGRALGQARTTPLPIGSVKSNIGHLEPASGVAGLLKATIALETRRLPATLHAEELNPLVDFEALNLLPARLPVALDAEAEALFCGVSSFGFGGTNAHVVLRSADRTPPSPAPRSVDRLVLSAASRDALRAAASAHADLLDEGVDPVRLAAAIATDRDLLKHRAVLSLAAPAAIAPALRAYAETGRHEAVIEGNAPARKAKVCFVYSGNGAQWVGMGRTAFANNPAFRRRFEEIDAAFATLSDRSLVADLHAEDLAERMRFGAFVQPLMFALQSAITAGLVAGGLVPDVVLGHSVGELAAADAAGAIGLRDALAVVSARSSCQEAVHGLGTMAVFAAERETVREFLAELGRDDIEIAADNGPTSVTVAGSTEAVRLAATQARRRRLAARVLDIEYPFHSRYLDGLRERMHEALGPIAPKPPRIPLVSTVTGDAIGDTLLDADHWWLNVREPVLFRKGIETAATMGAELFVEIGPKPILQSPIGETLKSMGANARVVCSLAEADDRDERDDPIRRTIDRAVANGAAPEGVSSAPGPADRALRLPTYPWQRSVHHFTHTSERLDVFGDETRHPLIGTRLAQGQHEWRTLLDARIVPYLADHVVDGEIVVPAAALAEMLLAVARDLQPDGPIGFEDFDILMPLTLPQDAMRELAIRHSPLSGFAEIWSRPRLGPDEWNLNARGRIVPTTTVGHDAPPASTPYATFETDEIYERAVITGIDYGPAFRLAVSAGRDDDTMDVRLAPPPGPGTGRFQRAQLLHPTSLDAALHGLLCLVDLEKLARETYLPIRFARLALLRDHAVVTAARLRIEKERTRSLTISIWLFDEAGALVAEIRDLLLRSVELGRKHDDSVYFHVETRAIEAPVAIDVADVLGETLRAQSPTPIEDARLMLRAHMRTLAHRALSRLADADRRLDWATLANDGRLAPTAIQWAAHMAEDLRLAGLAVDDGPAVELAADTGLPDPEPILATFATEFPAASAELMLAAHTSAEIETFLTQGEPIDHRASIVEQFETGSLAGAAGRRAVAEAVARLIAVSAIPPKILVAEPAARGLLSGLLPKARLGEARVSVAGTDRPRLERLAARLPSGSGIETLELSDKSPAAPDFDLLLVDAFGAADDDLAPFVARVRPGGAVLVVQPPRDPTFDFWFGTAPEWFARSADLLSPVGRLPTIAETRARLERAGLAAIRETPLDEEDGAIVLASVPFGEAAEPVVRRPAIGAVATCDASGDVLLDAIAAEALRRTNIAAGREDAPPIVARPDRICVVPHGRGDDRARTERAIAALRRELAAAIATEPHPRLVVVTRTGEALDIDPVGEAIRDFVRVVLNEHADCTPTLVDLSPALDEASAAKALLDVLGDTGNEREIEIDSTGVRVPRVRRGLPITSTALIEPAAMELDFPRRGALEHFAWRPKDRREPRPGEVEVEVIATGLNFRDVMLAMGLLDDDVLDEGLAGDVYGFECVGRVVAVGDTVTLHRVGDVVFGFAASAFATHVTAAAEVFVALPAGIAPESAAGIPVVFMTAWYALVECARLKAGEIVLIHGAAGGVGLAAIQIARSRGARIVATASAPGKHALAELFGAERVLDSRSLDFADVIRSDYGGVDVVLNSLSGEAMRASLKCLKPFGRFVELGKRDYVGNSEIGLRPFRRNLTYYGVDVDQLLAHDPATITRGLEDLVAGFADGRWAPIPYRVFGAEEIGEAFRLMQAAGHIGKIVVRPPSLEGRRVVPPAPRSFVPGDGVQLIVGGTGGFGFATAGWLVDKGATRVVVASRRGTVDETAEVRIRAWRAKGVDIRVETVDATDLASVEALVARIETTMAPIAGVYLTAMVLDDGLLDGLTEARIARVLAPKIDGAVNLDRATRGHPIEHFVLFSSATTLVGNPGQAAYVAANGFMQGLARRRRAEGLPALAVAWGAIADVGVLARDKTTAKKLERVTGVVGLTSDAAFRHLEDLLGRADQLVDPVVHCARFQRVGAMKELPILKTPAFESVFRGADGEEEEETETDIAALIAGKSDAEALRILGDLMATEVARILRLSSSDVDLNRPLDELGLDSLMALELRMNVETTFGIELPLVAITSVKNLRDLSQRMLQSLRSGDADEGERLDTADAALITMHGGDAEAFTEVADEIATYRKSLETKS